MKDYQYFMLLASIYLAPRMPAPFAILLSMICTFVGLFYMWGG